MCTTYFVKHSRYTDDGPPFRLWLAHVFHISFNKQLQPPVIQLQKGIDAFFVTQNRILFPFAANHTINKKCYSDRGSGNVSETEIQIKSGTILTIDKNCNYSSSFLTCFYQGSFSESHVNDTQEIFLPKLSPGFNFS